MLNADLLLMPVPGPVHAGLRWAVIFMYWQGLPIRKIARLICRSRSACLRWLGRYLITGSPAAVPWGRGRQFSIPADIGVELNKLLKEVGGKCVTDTLTVLVAYD